MNTRKGPPQKTVLTISMALLIWSVISNSKLVLCSSLIIGITGVFSDYLSMGIEIVWLRIAHTLGLIVPKIVLSAIFYLILFPIASISRLFRKKGTLMLTNKGKSTFVDSCKCYTPESFEKPW